MRTLQTLRKYPIRGLTGKKRKTNGSSWLIVADTLSWPRDYDSSSANPVKCLVSSPLSWSDDLFHSWDDTEQFRRNPMLSADSVSVDSRPTVGNWLLTDCRPTVNRQSTDCWFRGLKFTCWKTHRYQNWFVPNCTDAVSAADTLFTCCGWNRVLSMLSNRTSNITVK